MTDERQTTVVEGKNGLVVDEGDNGFVLTKPVIDVSLEEYTFENDTEETQETSTENTTEEPDLSIFDGLEADTEQAEETTEEPEKAPGFEKFSEDFKKYMGVDLQEAMNTLKELQTFRAEQAIKVQEQSIQESWGVDAVEYQSRMAQVRKYAATIAEKNPEMFAKLDNAEGVKLIWTKLEQERSKGSKKQVPQVQKSGSRSADSAGSKYDFTLTQINKMSREEYASKAHLIQQAFATGRVATGR